MEPKDETKRVLKAIDVARRARGWGGAGRLDRKLGNCPGYVARLLAGKPAMRLEQLFEILNALEFEAGEFFAWVFGGRYRFQPERYLRALAKKKEKTELMKQVDRIVDASLFPARVDGDSAQPEIDLSELASDISRLEEFRFTDPAAVRPESIQTLKSIVHLAEAHQAEVLPVLCDALSLTGAIEVALRNYSSSALYLVTALRLAKIQVLHEKEARILQRCCYLIATQGEYEAALSFADQALEIYILTGDMSGIGKCLVDQGLMLRRSGCPEQAIQRYEAALRYLPEERWQYRFSLHQSLGFAYLECGEVEKAEYSATMAAREHKTREGVNWGKLSWLHGEICLKKGQLDLAEAAFREVEEKSRGQGNCIDIALIRLRLALVLLKAGRVDEMLELVSDMVQLLDPLKDENKIAAKIMNDLIQLALVGKITMDFLDRAYNEILRAAHG